MTDFATPTPADIAAHVQRRVFTQDEVNTAVQAALRSQEQSQREHNADRDRDAFITDLILKYGLDPADKVLLTGMDGGTLTAQAERLSTRAADAQVPHNRAPREGQAVSPGEDQSMRRFARNLFGYGDE